MPRHASELQWLAFEGTTVTFHPFQCRQSLNSDEWIVTCKNGSQSVMWESWAPRIRTWIRIHLPRTRIHTLPSILLVRHRQYKRFGMTRKNLRPCFVALCVISPSSKWQALNSQGPRSPHDSFYCQHTNTASYGIRYFTVRFHIKIFSRSISKLNFWLDFYTKLSLT